MALLCLFFFIIVRQPRSSSLFPYTTLFRSLTIHARPEATTVEDLEALVRASGLEVERTDRKSTRLNSSHGYNSYAVFRLKKKKQLENVQGDLNRGTHTSSDRHP